MIIKKIENIILATSNLGKIQEIKTILVGLPFNILSQEELGIDSCSETGLTFVENAIIKARHAAICGGLPAIADDSGLVIDVLHGAPGILSARYAGENATMSDNVTKVLQELRDVPDEQRTAHFYCALAYFHHQDDPAPLICQGVWHGKILIAPRGKNGFGYDPIFFVSSHSCSAAELAAKVKNSISHRALALRQFRSYLRSAAWDITKI